MGIGNLSRLRTHKKFQSLIMPDGVFTPTPFLQGTASAVLHLRSALAQLVPTEISDAWPHCLDGILLHHGSSQGLVDSIGILLSMCSSWRIRLHPDKCVQYETELCWCRR